MSIVSDLLKQPGVMAAGVYTYKSELSDYEGELPEDFAGMAAAMCYATAMSTNMESDILAKFDPDNGIHPAQGWIMRGPQYTICVVVNVFCFVNNQQASLNKIIGFMRESLAGNTMDLV